MIEPKTAGSRQTGAPVREAGDQSGFQLPQNGGAFGANGARECGLVGATAKSVEY